MANSTSAILASILALLTFAGMQAFRTQLASSQLATVFGGFAGANIFVFLLTVSVLFLKSSKQRVYGYAFRLLTTSRLKFSAEIFKLSYSQKVCDFLWILMRSLIGHFSVIGCIAVAAFASALVHRVCVTTW